MDTHLGYDKYDVSEKQTQNSNSFIANGSKM